MRLLLLFIFIVVGCGGEYQKRNAEIIVTYEGKEEYRAGTKYKSFKELQEVADSPGKKYIIFAAEWCSSCKHLYNALTESGHLNEVVFINVDEPWAFRVSQIFKVRGVPTMIVVEDDGSISSKIRGPSKITMYLLINVKLKK